MLFDLMLKSVRRQKYISLAFRVALSACRTKCDTFAMTLTNRSQWFGSPVHRMGLAYHWRVFGGDLVFILARGFRNLFSETCPLAK